ncbi:MAG: hypothetical protein DHS20C18_55570 [Saprospiraceae bacterium]|nr:MAG: hypothetical protein DHS20C18_55570 [Saprospiraceae bacterium]
MENMNTITTEISGIQVKSLYIHFKTIKINNSINRINSLEFNTLATPEAISAKGDIIYDVIDAITLFENYHSLCEDVLKSPSLGPNLKSDLSSYLKLARKKMSQWKHVRNKLGGHLNLEVIEKICEKHNYKGVFITNHLEADFKGILLKMMLESAINETLDKSKLFEEEIRLTSPLGLSKFIDLFMDDWEIVLNLFPKLNKFIYEIGKEEKLNLITENDIGIIKF